MIAHDARLSATGKKRGWESGKHNPVSKGGEHVTAKLVNRESSNREIRYGAINEMRDNMPRSYSLRDLLG